MTLANTNKRAWRQACLRELAYEHEKAINDKRRLQHLVPADILYTISRDPFQSATAPLRNANVAYADIVEPS